MGDCAKVCESGAISVLNGIAVVDTQKCIACGKCVKVCPLNNIRLTEEKRPKWQSPCAHCMACICNCPTEAIEYGDVTQKKEKYHIRKYLPLVGQGQ